ncbi:hypothetical protein FHU36_001726 [Nonomuraea muscovyensis]|uniref:Uncharacterized protein n=1 Tax=Nonomuraea muscovyensis TaxID=1124761 RepID=A0A7X0BYQ7_9ACTN|nr:hypothetical protein [Nonomuraea muscovyensis]MBB6345217.1 hypothetical protein [Nonomuraea muscovyensis]
MPHPHARLALVAGLRALAQLLHDRPDIPAPRRIDVYHHARTAPDDEMRAEIDHIAALLGTTTEEHNGHYSTSIRLGAVEYQAIAILADSRTRHEAAEAAYRTVYDSTDTDLGPTA